MTPLCGRPWNGPEGQQAVKDFIGITTSEHKHAHFTRKLLHEHRGSFGAKSIRINRKTRVPDSIAYANVNGEHIGDLALQMIGRLGDKVSKNYPSRSWLGSPRHS